MCCDDYRLQLKIIMYTCGVKEPMQRVDRRVAYNPGGLERGLITWGNSMLTWDWTRRAFMTVQAIIGQISLYSLLLFQLNHLIFNVY
jgi:hypothetical protein